MKDVKLKLLIVVSVFCLTLTAGAQSVREFSDAFPVADRLYEVEGPVRYPATIQTEILSMSLSGDAMGPPVSLTIDPAGLYQIDSFFDVFVELSMDGGPPTIARLTGSASFEIVVPDSSSGNRTGTFQTEILSMDLSGDVGGIPIDIRENPGLPSPGETTLTDLGDGTFQIDSFFDVFTELSLDRGQTWTPADESSRMEVTPARLAKFNVRVEGNSDSWNEIDPPSSGGDGWADPQTGDQWLPYPQEDPEEDDQGRVEQGPFGATWWNEWWYDDPYDRERSKIINLTFNYTLTDPGIDGYVIVAVNWSTTDWSLNPPPGVDPSQQPPLSDFDPATPSVPWVGRWQVLTFPLNTTNPSGTYSSGDIKLPVPYNPEWVSIDVRGYNFTIEGGEFFHECVLDTDQSSVIEQLDWNGLNTSTPDSSWGRVTLDYNQSPGIYYFNLSIDNGSGPQWAIQNLSIESLGGDQTVMAYLDLGVLHGTDVSSLNYGYSIGNAPIPVGPGITGTTLVPDLNFQIGALNGIDLGSPGMANADPDASVAAAGSDPNSGVIPDLDKYVNQPQKPNYCAPGAISNSLKYLQARGKIPATVATSISDVASVLGTTAAGTPADGWYLKKATHYKEYVTTRTIEAPLDLNKVLELIKELKDGQDIEMELDGHVEGLVGMRLNPDGTVDMDLFDDNQTDKKSDPMHTSSLRGSATTQYVDDRKLVRFVIECPKESTIVGISTFSVNTLEDWRTTLFGENPHGSIAPMDPIEWQTYMDLWNNPDLLEDPAMSYPQNTFMPPQLYCYEGDGDPANEDPDDGGLVMHWGDPGVPGGQAAAWKYKYEPDPDLSNCIISVAVTAPVGITQVSLGLETPPAGSGNISSWYWNCGVGPGFPIQSGVPTTITIDTSITSTAAATPVATSYVSAPGFSITNVQWIIVDENGTWIGGPTPAPGPGGTPVFMWNYWHWLMVSPKTTLTKALLTKHSQGPVIIDTSSGEDPDVPLFWGWDEVSDYHMGPIAADDWECKDKRPVTDFHWWGSFPGWTEPYPPCHPKAFHIGIWTDTPAVTGDPESYSHPYELVWEHICENYVWNFAGYDRDPRLFDPHGPAGGADPTGNPIPGDDPAYEPNDSCFQYNQLLDGDDWFYQEPMDNGDPRTYWLSIAPIWDEDCDHEWGWKTRPKFYMDNAVSITAVSDSTGVVTWPPVLGNLWNAGVPLQIPAYTPQFPNHGDSVSWDLAFEISTNEEAYEDDPIPGDVGGPNGVGPDGIINGFDVWILAKNWLRVAP